jgi:hypothetical protein
VCNGWVHNARLVVEHHGSTAQQRITDDEKHSIVLQHNANIILQSIKQLQIRKGWNFKQMNTKYLMSAIAAPTLSNAAVVPGMYAHAVGLAIASRTLTVGAVAAAVVSRLCGGLLTAFKALSPTLLALLLLLLLMLLPLSALLKKSFTSAVMPLIALSAAALGDTVNCCTVAPAPVLSAASVLAIGVAIAVVP